MSNYAYGVLIKYKIPPTTFLRMSAREQAFIIASIHVEQDYYRREMRKYDRTGKFRK